MDDDTEHWEVRGCSISIGDQPDGVDALGLWRMAKQRLDEMHHDFVHHAAALLCWHKLYRWPAIRYAASMAYTWEHHNALMFIADHAKPSVSQRYSATFS